MAMLLRLTVANMRSLVRDRAALFWTFFFPIMFVFLFGAIFSNSGSSKLNVGVVDLDGTPASAPVRTALEESGVFVVHYGALDQEKADMQDGKVGAVIVIPAGLGQAMQSKGATGALDVQVYTDPSQQTNSQVVQQVVGQIVNGVNMGAAGARPVLQVVSSSLATTDLPMVNYLIPSILAMSLMQLGVFACVPLVEQREKQILKRIGATPLPRWTLVGSNILLRLVIAAIQTVLILGIGAAVFHVQLQGNPIAIAGLVLLGSATFLSLGYLVASFLRTEEQANAVTQVIQMPMMFLSGIFFPFSMLPDFLSSIGKLMPLTYLGDAMRQVMVNGTALAPLTTDIAILGAWLVACLAITVRFFRWE